MAEMQQPAIALQSDTVLGLGCCDRQTVDQADGGKRIPYSISCVWNGLLH